MDKVVKEIVKMKICSYLPKQILMA